MECKECGHKIEKGNFCPDCTKKYLDKKHSNKMTKTKMRKKLFDMLNNDGDLVYFKRDVARALHVPFTRLNEED